MRNLKILKSSKNNFFKKSAEFNKRLQEMLTVNIVSFEISAKDNVSIFSFNDDLERLKELCSCLGFDRHFSDSFDRNFIFGNNYEISRIIGCHLHSLKELGLSVPSARVDFEDQDLLKLRNYFIPEKSINELQFSLTGKYVEYIFTFSIEPCNDGSFDKNFIANDSNSPLQFNLEPMPNKKHDPRNQIISYEHTTSVEVRKNLREVHLQRFVCKEQQ